MVLIFPHLLLRDILSETRRLLPFTVHALMVYSRRNYKDIVQQRNMSSNNNCNTRCVWGYSWKEHQERRVWINGNDKCDVPEITQPQCRNYSHFFSRNVPQWWWWLDGTFAVNVAYYLDVSSTRQCPPRSSRGGVGGVLLWGMPLKLPFFA